MDVCHKAAAHSSPRGHLLPSGQTLSQKFLLNNSRAIVFVRSCQILVRIRATCGRFTEWRTIVPGIGRNAGHPVLYDREAAAAEVTLRTMTDDDISSVWERANSSGSNTRQKGVTLEWIIAVGSDFHRILFCQEIWPRSERGKFPQKQINFRTSSSCQIVPKSRTLDDRARSSAVPRCLFATEKAAIRGSTGCRRIIRLCSSQNRGASCVPAAVAIPNKIANLTLLSHFPSSFFLRKR